MSELDRKYKIITGIITFNHERFIAKTIQGAIDQIVDFDYQIVIFDDCSTDNTPQIIQSFKEKYPEKITIYLQKENISVGNIVYEFYATVKNKSDYLAIVEGDDYWNFNLKLKTQVDFLDKNKDYVGCFHDALINSSNNEEGTTERARRQTHGMYKTYSQFNKYSPDFYEWDLFQRNIIPTSSLVFRNLDFDKFTSKFRTLKLSLNWAFHLALIRNSKFKYLNETWSVYNDHPEGFSKKFEYNEFKVSNVKILKFLTRHGFYKSYDINLNKAINNEYRLIIFNQNIKKHSFGYLLKYIIKYAFSSLKLTFIESLFLLKFYFQKEK